jgi:dimethylargininase
MEEHAAYRSALAELGARVVHLPPLDDLPDAAFVEDAAVVLRDVAVITRPGAEARREECEPLATVLADAFALARIPPPAMLDGGDVLKIGDVLYVGQSTRTNHAGLKALAHLVLEHGYRVKAVSVRGALHLKTACTYLGRETLLANPSWADLARFAGFQVLEVDPTEPFAANALRIRDTLVMSSAYPRTLRRVESAGFEVRPVDISQFALAEAGVTCLSLVFDAPRELAAPRAAE